MEAVDANDDSANLRDGMNERADVAEGLATCSTLTDLSGTPTLKLSGALDLGSVAAVRSAIDTLVAERPSRVIIDLSELRFMDSSGLTLLLGVIDQVAEVELRDPPAMIRQLIHITGLTHLFVITPAHGSTLPDTNKRL